MNFFEQQDKARKRTSTLVFYFILAIIFIILAIDGLILGLIIYSSPVGSLKLNDLAQNALIIGIGVTPFVLIVIGIGTLVRMFQTRGGGISVAEMVKARPLGRDTEDFKEKRFINIVEEMSIASGVNVPQLFVMDNETAINAFVAGVHANDMVMVVTKGALDTLDRDALQGVVGHEFSHIFNGDMKINLKLIGLLGGIFAIGQLGAFILRSLQFSSSSRSSSSSSNSKGNGIFVVIIFGIGLFAIGYIGLFFGRLIKAGISRQRESLADACSVQYTRNPQGLIQALTAIQASQTGSKLTSSHAEDINHMCFGPSLNMWFTTMLASHPPIEERIKALDPQGYLSQEHLPGTHSSKQPATEQKTDAKQALGNILLTPAMIAMSSTIENSIGNPQLSHIDYAQQLLASIPENLKNQCYKQEETEFLLYAILMASDDELVSDANKLLATTFSPTEVSKIVEYFEAIKQLGAILLLPLIDIILPTFNQNNKQYKMQVIEILERMAAIHNTLFAFSVIAMIKKSALNQASSKLTKQVDMNKLIPEISELIQLMVSFNHNSNKSKVELYNELMSSITDKAAPEYKVVIFDARQFQKLLIKLNYLTPIGKEKLLHACLACIEFDHKINIEEAQAIRAIAAYLGCPIPPIIPTMTE